MSLLWIPIKILFFLFVFVVLFFVAGGFLYKAYQEKQAKDVADQPEEIKQHAKEGLGNPKEEKEIDDQKA